MLWGSCTYEHFSSIPSQCASTSIALTLTAGNVSTCGAADGSLAVTPAGGKRPYVFSINGGNFLTDSSYQGLKAGSYTVIARDANGCTGTQIGVINNGQSPLHVSIAATPNTGCPTPNGTLTATVTGQQDPVRYQLNAGTLQTSNVFTALAGGHYTITAVDATGCPTTATATVTSNSASFKTDVSPVIASYCGNCHAGNRSPNLTTYTEISAAGNAVVGAINSNMPPGTKLTATQIALITCWVNDGAPNN